jgi:transposase-like protein
MRWPEGFICPKCGHDHYYYLETRKLYQCEKCRHQTSVTAGSIFHKSKTALKKWFWAVFLCSRDKGGISDLTLKKYIKVSYQTAWTMMHKIRKAMDDRDGNYQLSNMLEIDDCYFGGPSAGGKRGRGTKKTKVLVQLALNENGNPKFTRMTIVDDLKSDNILEKIKEKVAPEAMIKTDGFKTYIKLGENGYRHRVEKSTMKWIHVIISNAKTFLRGTFHGACKRHLQKYLNEFCYRFNRRFWENQLFNRLLTACSSTFTVTYAELSG